MPSMCVVGPGVWVHISKTYQFLSASFRNLTNAINSTYYQAFMRNVWESVVSEAWRGSPFILAGPTMQPDRFLNRILIGYFFFFLEGKCQNLRVRAFFHETVRVCHVYCNFKIGFTCRITVIFGTLNGGSLLINTSNICFSYRNMFQNGVDALSKIVDVFLS